jgi:hypothetical protein
MQDARNRMQDTGCMIQEEIEKMPKIKKTVIRSQGY